MVISIQLQTTEDIKLLEPVLKLLRQTKTTFKVQSSVPLDKSRREGIRRMLQLVRSNEQPKVTKIEIPTREERNER